MAAVRIAVGEETAAIYFKYDEELVDLVRGFSGRVWNKTEKFWTIYREDAQRFKTQAERLGHKVIVTASTKHEEDTATKAKQAREEQQKKQKARNAWRGARDEHFEEEETRRRTSGNRSYRDTGYWNQFFQQEQERRNREYARRQQQGAYDDPRNWQNRQGQSSSSSGGSYSAAGMTSADGNGWAVLMFRAVGKDMAKSVYRAMSRALHPDIAGDNATELMKQLNAAYERWKD
jgi:hypothetical protein